MIAVVDRPIPAVPDTGTEKAARLANEVTGNPGGWVRLDCQHTRHVQRPVGEGQQLDCPSCPPSRDGSLARRRVLHGRSEHRLVARLSPRPLTPGKARRLAAEAVADQGPGALVEDVAQVVRELVANAVRHTEAPVELTVDARDNVVRIQLAGGRSAGVPVGAGSVVWAAELRGPDTA